MFPPWLRLCLSVACLAFARSSRVEDWPNVLGSAWLFDQGSTFGYRLEGGSMRGPAPDWALGDASVPVIRYEGHSGENLLKESVERSSASYPGSILVTAGRPDLQFSGQLAFESANVSLVKLTLENLGDQQISSWFNITGSGATVSASAGGFSFALPKPTIPCFPAGGGHLLFVKSALLDGELQPLQWTLKVTLSQFEAKSQQVDIAPRKTLVAFALLTHGGSEATEDFLPDAIGANHSFSQSISRWEGYLQAILRHKDANMDWTAVKSIMTLVGNWRAVPGLPAGVLPSYSGYEGGFWSWDTYKQAVGMAHFAPQLAKEQLRLLVSAQESSGHIPDKVDRCGQGGGCNGKPPLLAWAVWEVFTKTQDSQFLRAMYPAVRDFHHFWYQHRDVTGTGLCSWTEGMESGMDDGVRFQPEYAKSVSNTTTHETTLDFWSVDLNSYLYQEKRLLSQMATELGFRGEAQSWTAAAEALLPRLRDVFFVDGGRAGFFSDVYFNGSALPIKGCEGFAALFNGVATLPQALKMVETLRDPEQFFLNFSLPTVSKDNKFFNAHGYWKGPTWIDQTWFAYTGLRRYESLAKAAGVESAGSLALVRRAVVGMLASAYGVVRLSAILLVSFSTDQAPFAQLASVLKQKIFTGNGFVINDTTPFTEHYDPETGVAAGVPQFSWTAAHALMWIMEAANPPFDEVVWI